MTCKIGPYIPVSSGSRGPSQRISLVKMHRIDLHLLTQMVGQLLAVLVLDYMHLIEVKNKKDWSCFHQIVVLA